MKVETVSPVVGTFEWMLFKVYADHRDFTGLKDPTKAVDLRRMRIVCELRMKDDSRLGDWPLKQFEPEIADRIYELLLLRHRLSWQSPSFSVLLGIDTESQTFARLVLAG